mgnify:CR=1 FL=1
MNNTVEIVEGVKPEISICGACDLAAAILGQPPDALRLKFGIPLKGYYCRKCGKRLHHKPKGGYCRKCYPPMEVIPVSCSQCGDITYKPKYLIIHNTKEGQQYFFCNRKCFGKWAGINYGFKSHPKNIRGGERCKWDWDMVWQKHLETGYGALRLSRMLNIPIGTISKILWRLRQVKACKKEREND